MKRLCVRSPETKISPIFMPQTDSCKFPGQRELCLIDAHGSCGLDRKTPCLYTAGVVVVQIEMATLTLQHHSSLMRRSTDIFSFLKGTRF